jgi:hypothetical protein
MVSPAPVNPPGQHQIADPREMEVRSPGSTSATSRFLDTFGFHLLIVLLGIALAFM